MQFCYSLCWCSDGPIKISYLFHHYHFVRTTVTFITWCTNLYMCRFAFCCHHLMNWWRRSTIFQWELTAWNKWKSHSPHSWRIVFGLLQLYWHITVYLFYLSVVLLFVQATDCNCQHVTRKLLSVAWLQLCPLVLSHLPESYLTTSFWLLAVQSFYTATYRG